MNNTTDNVLRVAFAAVNPYVETHIVKPTETVSRYRHIVDWGEGNKYPEYLLDLFNSSPTLRTIIIGTADFICGDDVVVEKDVRGIDRDSVHNFGLDDNIYGGFAIEVIRNAEGKVAETNYIDIRYLRSDRDNEEFRYSEKWSKSGKIDVIVYPRFRNYSDDEWAALSDEERERNTTSIYYVKNTHTQTYPAPPYAAAVKDCEIERGIADYHFNNLENGFVSSMIINFNNGVPTDQVREQIERECTEKFTGHQNAGRVMFSWNANRTNETTFNSPKVEDFTAKYDAMEKSCVRKIYTAFRAVPALFGLMTETTGFAQQEFAEAFRLYNRTVVRPAQQRIIEALHKIWERPVLTIKPFSLGDGNVIVNVQ